MPILNMVGGGSGGANLAEPTDLAVALSGNTAIITRTDPDTLRTVPATTFSKSVLVRKVGSAPTSPSDGTVVVTETTKDTYKTTGYEDTGITKGTEYYYRVFSYSADGGISYGDSVNIAIYSTYTVVWNETSNPSQFFVRYEDDAAGLTQGDGSFDDFFGYEAVVLNNDGNIVGQPMKQSKGVFTSTMSSFISGKSGNVMIKFPIRGIKMSKSGSTVTLSITEEKNKDGYQYYAFNSQGVTQDYLYLGAYKGSISNSKLVSVSGASSIYGFGISTAVAGVNKYSNHRYHEMTFYARQYINALYMMKYGNPYSRSVIGNGARGNTGRTNSLKNASGVVSNRVRLFGLEDLWGNGGDILEGSRYANSAFHYNSNGDFSTSSYITSFDKYSRKGLNSGVITSVDGSNDIMFTPSGIDKYGNRNQNYCDKYDYTSDNQNFSIVAGNYYNDTSDVANGLFFISVSLPESNTSSYAGCRLMYL